MKIIGIASDHAGFELKQYVKKWLEAKGWEYKDFGTYTTDSCDYPDYAHPLAVAVENGECYPGIAICGSQTPRHTCSPLLDAGNSTHVEVTQ